MTFTASDDLAPVTGHCCLCSLEPPSSPGWTHPRPSPFFFQTPWGAPASRTFCRLFPVPGVLSPPQVSRGPRSPRLAVLAQVSLISARPALNTPCETANDLPTPGALTLSICPPDEAQAPEDPWPSSVLFSNRYDAACAQEMFAEWINRDDQG